MAYFDDKLFLLSHIRHSFITCDPTEMCEMVMLHEPMPHYFGSVADVHLLKTVEIEAKSDLLDATQSCEIVSDIEMITVPRGRSNTAQRLERLKEEKRTAAKTKYVHRKDTNVTDELSELFPRKSDDQIKEASLESVPKKSVLSFLVENSPDNPFQEFAKYDARVGDRRRTRNYEIILHDVTDERRLKTLQVVIFANARVRDLIGLTCWLYTNDDNEPTLEPDVDKYCLKIAEDNGEIDTDFPALRHTDMIEKYDFPTLAMVKSGDDRDVEASPISSTFVNFGLDTVKPRIPTVRQFKKRNYLLYLQKLRDYNKRNRLGHLKKEPEEGPE